MHGERLKNIYSKINNTLIFLDIYVLTFPFWAKVMYMLVPQLNQCVYRKVAGKLCPFCGSTTYIKNFWQGNLELEILYDIKFVILICLILNLIFRLYNLSNKYKYLIKVIWIDVVFNLIVVIILIITVINFTFKL